MLTPFSPAKILWHRDRLERALRGEWVGPVSVEVDLSNKCNHGCPWCSFNGYRQAVWQHVPTARLLTLLEELREAGVESLTFTGGGEPLVHPDVVRILRAVIALGFAWGLVTNGRLLARVLDEVRAARFVRVSLDAGTAQTHQLLHATATPEFDIILDAMGAVAAQTRDQPGERPTLGASFCVFDVNVEEIPEAARRVAAVGADYLEVRPVFPTTWRGGGFDQPLRPAHIARARELVRQAAAEAPPGFQVLGLDQRFEEVVAPGKRYARCHIGPLTTVLAADGCLYHCCQQRGREAFRIGSVLDRPFREVWLSEEHRRLLAGIDVAQCPPCRYDGYNELIETVVLRDGMHRAFL